MQEVQVVWLTNVLKSALIQILREAIQEVFYEERIDHLLHAEPEHMVHLLALMHKQVLKYICAAKGL